MLFVLSNSPVSPVSVLAWAWALYLREGSVSECSLLPAQPQLSCLPSLLSLSQEEGTLTGSRDSRRYIEKCILYWMYLFHIGGHGQEGGGKSGVFVDNLLSCLHCTILLLRCCYLPHWSCWPADQEPVLDTCHVFYLLGFN